MTERNKAMIKKATKLISLLLSVVMLLGMLPMQVIADGIDRSLSKVSYPTGDSDGLILEFSSAGALEVFRTVYGGRVLGGNMLLVDGSYEEAVCYEKMPNIESVTYNYTLEAAGIAEDFGTAPTDPRISDTYVSAPFLDALGKMADEAGLSSLYTVRVAVLDTGIDATHEDLVNRVVAGYDAINNAAIAKGINSDIGTNGHGTKVAGLIGAEADNGVGLCGMAGKYPLELIPVRVLGEDGKGKIADVVRGIYWAIDNGADILNMSFGANMSYYPTALANAIRDARRQNVFSICAGGNDTGYNSSTTYSGFYPADLQDAYPVLAGYYMSANIQSFSYCAKYSDVPGYDYVGHDGSSLLTTEPGGGYTRFTGTSASCAAISGYTAVMFSLLGGRTNPEAITAAKRMFAYGHGGVSSYNKNYHVYNFRNMTDMDDSIRQAFISSVKATRVTIQGGIECRNVLTGTVEITGRLTVGATLAKDATLVVYNEEGTALYASEPVLKTATEQTEYIFTLDTSGFKDGNITLKIFYRTAAEAEANKDATTVQNFSEYATIIRNSLVVTKANLYIYDPAGSAIAGQISVYNADTGKFLQKVGGASSSEIEVDKKLFDENGGRLTFSFVTDDMIFTKTSAFAPEISLGGDEAQKTTLHFSGSKVTLSYADIKLCYGSDSLDIGNTDSAGDITFYLSDGEHRFFVKDEKNRYLIFATAVQDGNKTEISLAEDIDAAREITISAVDSLGNGDLWTVVASNGSILSASDGMSLNLYGTDIKTVYLSPVTQNLAVGIYDVIHHKYVTSGGTESTIRRYCHVTHILGEVDVNTMNSIDFDPTKIITQFDIGTDTLCYGENTTIVHKAVDDKGNILVGGEILESAYSTTSTNQYFNSIANEFSMKSANEEDTTDYYSGMVEDYPGTLYAGGINRWPKMPIAECDYILNVRYALKTDLSYDGTPYVDFLPYQFNTVTKTLHVKLDKMMTLRLEVPEGYTSAYASADQGNIYIVRNGKVETPTAIGYKTEEDGTYIVYLDAKNWDDVTDVFVAVRLSNNSESIMFFDYFPYDPANPTRTVTKPNAEFGELKVYLGQSGRQVYSPLLFVNYGGHTFTTSAYDKIPVGSYHVGGVDSVYGSDKTETYYVFYRGVNVAAEGTNVVLSDEEFREYNISNNDSSNSALSLIPELGGIVMDNSDGNSMYVYSTQKFMLDSGVTGMYAKLSERSFQWEGSGTVFMLTLPLNQTEFTVSGREIDSFVGSPGQSEFTAEQDVLIDLNATVSGGLRITDIRHVTGSNPKMGITGEVRLLPLEIKYRKAGGDWQKKEFFDWTGINLGKLETGEYEVVISFAGDTESALASKETTFAFKVSGAPSAHFVTLTAPNAAADDVILTISGKAGAIVSVSYTTPGGTAKTLNSVTLPANGIYRLSAPLTEYGSYAFSAVSKLEGESDATAEVSVESVPSYVSPITGFKVTNGEAGELKLAWDAPVGTGKLWITRDGVTLGCLTEEYTSYNDKNLDSNRIYTYEIVFENAAGRRSSAVSAMGKPTGAPDTEKPTAPAVVTSQISGTSITLNWTRATDNVRVSGYRIYRDGVLIRDTAKRTFIDEGLAIDTEYSYYIKAYDGAGNESDASMTVTAKTPDGWSIDKLDVSLERNRDGYIIRSTLNIRASIGAGIDSAVATVVYKTLDDKGTLQTEKIDLGNAGTAWNGVCKLSRIYEIVSVTVTAYKDGVAVAEKAAEGFPCLIASSVSIALTVSNAPFAKAAVGNMQIVLRGKQRNTTYTMPVLTESETNFYSFDGLSAGTYTLSVLKDGRTVYEVGEIAVAAEADRVLTPHTISGFFRFKSPYGTALLYTPARLSDGYSVDENGYLTNGEDSAFWYSGETVRFYRVCEEYCEVEGGFYRLPQYQNITLNDSKEYTLAPLSGFDSLQSQRIRFRFSLASGKSLAGLSVQVSTMGNYRKTVTLDQNGEATVLLLKPDVGGYRVSYSVADTALYSEDGSVVAYLPSQNRFFMLWQSDAEVLLTPQLQEAVIETIRLKFKSDAPLEGVTGTLRSNLNDQLSFRLDASGEIELPLKTAIPGDYQLSIDSRLTDDYYIPPQSLSLEGTDYTMTVKAQKIEKQTVKLKFTDPSGYSVEGATVLISTAFTRKGYTLGADGILSAEVFVESRNAEAKSISVQIFGRNGNILWDDSLYLSLADVLNGEYEIRINSLISIRMGGAGWNQYERHLFYTQDGTKKAICLQSDNSVVPSNIIALGGELIAVPRPINTMLMLPDAAQERYDLLKSLTAIQSFVLNKETAETVFRIEDSKTEYYTVNSPTDLVGNRIPRFECFVLIGDTPILSSLGAIGTSARIPKLTNGQRVIIRPRSTKDISESLKHLGTYCAEWILDDLSPHERSFQLGFQSIYEFRLEDKDGNQHDGELARIFDNSKKLTTKSSLRVNISDPLSPPETLFAAWVGYVEPYTASVYSYWVDVCNSGTAARFDFNDMTTAYPETIVLTADYELLYRIPRYTGEHDTNIKSVKQQKDGSYLVRLTQNGANGYHSLIALPAGAFNVMLDGTEQTSRELELQPGKISHDVSFSISEADLKSDNSIRCYIITPQGNRSLQFVREIDYDIFAYSVPMKISTNEVMFHEALRNGTSLLGPGITQPVQSIFYFNLGTRFGTYWGLERRLFTNAITGKTTSTEYDRLNPASQYYKPDYTVDDYRDTTYTAFAQGGSYKAFECKWVSFKANTDDFAIALNVDGAVTYIDTLWPNASYFSSTRIVGFKQYIPPDNLSCSFTAGYDKENNCYWLTSAFLEKYGFYDRSTGYGILPIPMSEPDSYPHTYKAELKFKYKNGAGETEMLENSNDIRMYYDAPVLQKWDFDHYTKWRIETSPMHYVTITNRADREGCKQQQSNNNRFTLDWNGTDIFTFRAWFDKPSEVCNVYAIGNVPTQCDNFAIKLEYDEELGCYTGTGMLGDALNPPKQFSVVYELVAEQPYNGMPTVQLKDMRKTEQERNAASEKQYNLPEGWTVKENAPTNGWTLAETYRAWEKYAELYNSDKPITKETLLPILGKELILYRPLLEIYNPEGKLVGTVQNYYDFSGKALDTQIGVDVAVMDGGKYITKVTSGASRSEDGKSIRFAMTSDDPAVILPDIKPTDVSSAGWGTVGKAVGTAVGAYSDYSTLDSVADYAASEADAAGWKNNLTPEQREAYNDYKQTEALRVGVESVMGISGIGAAVTVVGDMVIETVLGDQDVDGQYRKMAQLNEQMKKQQEEMEFFKEHGYRPGYPPPPAEPNIKRGANGFPLDCVWGFDPDYYIDPSGYIFEGTENNLLDGVRATVYYLDKASGEWVKWDSEAHGEGPNPNISGADGKYGWDVLIGKWKVVFEKDGYYTVESIELDVPPAHLDVNMSMVSTSPATLKEVKAGAMGAYIDFTFDRPVLVDDAKRLVSVMLGGDALDGNVEALNAALTAFGNKQKAGVNDVTVGLNVATKFRFTPEDPIEVGASVKVVGEKGILTYNGIEMAAFESGYVLVPETVADPITALSYTGIKEIEIGATLDLKADLTITGSEGTLTFKAKTPTVATVDENGVVTAVSGGIAYFEISCGAVRTMAAVSVKEAPHAHSFTEEYPLMEYLASEATCTEPAKYYRFCSCGIVGTETYSHGDAKGHVFGEWTLNLADNTCERTCSVCGEVEKDNSMSLLSVSGKTAKAGGTVSVTISLANNPGIAALAFRVSYPKGAMTLESAVAGGLFGSATLNTSTGMFLFDDAADVTENGTLLTLTFKVSDMAALGEYRISVEIISCNNAAEERVVICGGQANIEVRDILPGDANGDGVVDTLDITRLRRYLAEESVDLSSGADMNGDGVVDIEDLARLRRYLVESGTGLGG